MERRRVLAVASGGGHWVQLRRLAPALEEHDVHWMTTDPGYRDEVGDAPLIVVRDASLWNKFSLLRQAWQIWRAVRRVKPHVIVSTGAAPGYFAIRFGKWRGAKTVWIDSMANVEQLSLSGQKVGKHVDLWLTQWEHLAKPEGPHFEGGVL